VDVADTTTMHDVELGEKVGGVDACFTKPEVAYKNRSSGKANSSIS
jgi:hypothetical protein